MKNKLALFDLDGTLFDTCRVNHSAYQYALAKYGVTIDYDDFCKNLNGRHYRVFLPRMLGGDEHVEEVHDIKVAKYQDFLHHAVINESLFSMIDCMKDEFHIAIVSTAAYDNCHQILEHFKVKDKFELILTQRDVEKKKPDPEGFIKAMEYFGIGPENTIVFEDSEVGVEAARRAGCVTYVVKGYS